MPESPARKKSASSRAVSRRGSRLGQSTHKKRYPSTKRVQRISTGVNTSRSTFVETKVTPQMMTVTSASA